MHNFILFIKEFRIYSKKELLNAATTFTKKQSMAFFAVLSFSVICLLLILGKVNSMFLIDVPISGGTLTEGIVGVPTLVNPVVALSDADKDLTSLIYSGLMRKSPDGKFIPDLAESFSVSPDGTNYTFNLKKNAKFHDGSKVTADDIIFTIGKIKDPLIKSPHKLGWDGVTVTKKDDYIVTFTLSAPYISFMDNTTVGILPSKLWKDVDSNKFNLSPLDIKPVGSGPYKVKSVTKSSDGTSGEYKLERFNNFTLGEPQIKYLNIVSYANEKDVVKALSGHYVDQAGGISPENAKDFEKGSLKIHTAILPRIFGMFFNSSNNKIFADPEVVKAINKAIDREDIVNQVLIGYGKAVESPIPEKILKDNNLQKFDSSNIDEANVILDKSGWTKGSDGIRTKSETSTKTITKKIKGKTITQTETVKNSSPAVKLSFSLMTLDTPELRATTELIKEQLAKIGIAVDTSKVYEIGQLNQLIRSRNYEALFFGQIVNHESDLYSFWHSSQRADPGLNIAMYNNKKVDTILESIQKTLDSSDRATKYESLMNEFENNIPAILIYSPEYVYITSPNLNNLSLDYMTAPSDRFSLVYTWSVDTDKVWKIFTK